MYLFVAPTHSLGVELVGQRAVVTLRQCDPLYHTLKPVKVNHILIRLHTLGYPNRLKEYATKDKKKLTPNATHLCHLLKGILHKKLLLP